MMLSSWIAKRCHVVTGFLSVLLVASTAVSAEPDCNLPGNACLLPPSQDPLVLQACLLGAFPPTNQTYGFFKLPKVSFPGDEKYAEAKRTTAGVRFPAVVVMAESEDDVVTAVNCATAAGYRISPRGRNHHFQGLSNMDGYVVIDCSLLCDPATFEVKREEREWLLPGQKVLGTVKAGSGCTNAVMLAATFKEFDPEEGSLYAIGTCPSVGITGYTTGGGSGDITPYTGWGSDDLVEARVVLQDGSVVTASEKENSDLFWALQGGGSGLGVIVSLTTYVIQAPEPPEGETSRKYSFVYVGYSTPDDESNKKWLTSFQDFLYEADPVVSSKFGGSGGLAKDGKILLGIFLGGAKEFLETFRANALLEDDALQKDPIASGYPYVYTHSRLIINNDVICNGTAPCPANTEVDLPSQGVSIAEFDTYHEAMLYKLCSQITPPGSFLIGEVGGYTQASGDWCADLKIDSSFCDTVPVPAIVTREVCQAAFPGLDCDQFTSAIENTTYSYPAKCEDPEVIMALLEAAYDPLSFFNNAGPPSWLPGLLPFGGNLDLVSTRTGGTLIPKVDIDTLMDLSEIGVQINHFQHGAPMQRESSDTAFPWRDTAIMTPPDTSSEIQGRMVEFYGDYKKVKGYVNYPYAVGNPNWRQLYYGENYERLSEIKLGFDPLNTFGNFIQVQPANPQMKSGSDESQPSAQPSPSPSKKDEGCPTSAASKLSSVVGVATAGAAIAATML